VGDGAGVAALRIQRGDLHSRHDATPLHGVAP
jgi:hypothetical protein